MTIVPTSFWEFLMSFEAHERFPLTIVLIVFGSTALVIIIGIVSHMVTSIHKNRIDDALKRDLIDRGMTADEIAKLLRSPPNEDEDE